MHSSSNHTIVCYPAVKGQSGKIKFNYLYGMSLDIWKMKLIKCNPKIVQKKIPCIICRKQVILLTNIINIRKCKEINISEIPIFYNGLKYHKLSNIYLLKNQCVIYQVVKWWETCFSLETFVHYPKTKVYNINTIKTWKQIICNNGRQIHIALNPLHMVNCYGKVHG